ncbi:L-ascorbate oxidase [Xylariomycetidae sp. FL2044]|nr:L-ascorbate oxidase [Xylariomycetidae sp. FL2044]
MPPLPSWVGLLQTCRAVDVEIHNGSWQPEYVLVATEQNVTINCESRRSIVFNSSYPAPPLYLREGKTTWIRVYNDIENLNITVHWHGLTQRTAPFSDGTPIVSQWPIAPGQYFDYEIHPEEGDAGTYFYHSHIGFQASTAHGLLVVEDAKPPPYQYDGDIPLVLGDYFNKTDETIEQGLRAIPFQWSGEPNALILNDRTGTKEEDEAADDSCKASIITVEPGKTYRLRFVGASSLSFIQAAIECHSELTIIGADGTYTKPATTDHIQLGSGQRFDVLLKTKTLAELDAEGRDQFWVRFESRGRTTFPGGYAVLQYDTGSNSTYKGRRDMLHKSEPRRISGGTIKGRARPYGKFPETSPVALPTEETLPYWLEYTLEALNPVGTFPKLEEVTRTVRITVGQQIVSGGYINGTITGSLIWKQNNLKWTEMEAGDQNYTPYLIQAYMSGITPDYDAAVANGGWDPKTNAFPAKVGEVLDIVWESNSGPTGGFEYHPMHAHGEHYFDLGSGNGTYDAVANEVRFANYTPARRDTTVLHRYTTKGVDNTTAGWRAWRIRVTEDNVGAWMMHCHILQHMVMGMQTVWVFGDAASILKEIPQPYIDGYLDYGGDAYGNDTYDPLVMEYFEN